MRRIATGVAFGLAALILSTTASAAIKISGIHFDSPGSDYGSNSSLNAEWIRVKNTGTTARSLTNWTVRDVANHVYRFGTYTFGAGKTVTVHTGNGSNTAAHRYWKSDWYIWNNDGDRATLKKPDGNLIDRCLYSGAGSSVTC